MIIDIKRLLSKFAAESEIQEESASRSAAYASVDEDSSAESKQQFASVEEFQNNFNESSQADWQPKLKNLKIHFKRLNGKHGYFEYNEKLMYLFRALTMSCRKVCVLIEKNNTPDDTMAYDYAYKLMALLIDKNKPLPSFEKLSKQVESLLKPKDMDIDPEEKYFHKNLLDLKLPSPQHDREGWLFFIRKYGVKALPFFSIAEKIEEQLEGKAPKTLDKAIEVKQRLTYQRALEDREWTGLCSRYQVPEETFNLGLDYIGSGWPKKEVDKIPELTIEQGPYIWTKLSARDKRGLILGTIVHCCQSIGDHSSQCVEDAMSLDENALYVLLKRKKEVSSQDCRAGVCINDQDYQIIGQSYVWKSKTGNLCLDSIECVHEGIKPEELREILIAFGVQVFEVDTSVKRVTLGTGGKTPEHLFAEEVKIPEQISQGLFYGDATKQYLISKTPSRLTEEQIATLKAKYSVGFCEILFYLSDYFADTTHFSDEIEALIARYPNLPQALNIKAINRLLHYTCEPSFDDLEYIDFDALQPTVVDSTISHLSTARVMWQADTPAKIIKALPYISHEGQVAAVKEKDLNGKTVLHCVAKKPKSLQMILSFLSESERLAAVKEKDLNGNTVLHCAAKKPKSLKMILSFLSESERLAAVKDKNEYGETVLHCTKNHPKSPRMLLLLYPESERLAAVKEQDLNGGNTVLDYVGKNPELLEMILSLLPESERLVAVKEKNQYGMTVLYCAAKKPESLQMILSLYPESERLAALKEKDIKGETVLHLAAKNPELLEMILSLLPESERLVAVKEKDLSGRTLLHYAENNPKSLRMILLLYPKSERLAAMKEKDRSGRTLLHCAGNNPESFKMILSLHHKSERLAVVKEKDGSGRTLLHCAGNNPESLKMLLPLYPKSERLAAVNEQNEFSETVLHLAAKNPKSLLMLLSLYTESECLAAMKMKDRKGVTVLHLAAQNPTKSLQNLLLLYPTSELLAAVKEQNEFGDTVLHYAAKNPKSLQMILSFLSKSERLAVVKNNDRYDVSLLNMVAENPKSLRMILSLYPKSELPAVLKEKYRDKSVLYSATKNPESFEMILSLYPESKRLAAMLEKDRDDKTILNYVNSKPKLFQIFLSSFSISNLLTLGQQYSFIEFVVLKNVIITKVEKLSYTPEQLTWISNASNVNVLNERFSIISQRRFKDSLPKKSCDESKELEYKLG